MKKPRLVIDITLSALQAYHSARSHACRIKIGPPNADRRRSGWNLVWAATQAQGLTALYLGWVVEVSVEVFLVVKKKNTRGG